MGHRSDPGINIGERCSVAAAATAVATTVVAAATAEVAATAAAAAAAHQADVDRMWANRRARLAAADRASWPVKVAR